jgi:hypothetical protein
MGQRWKNCGWMAALRRDRLLFAIAGSLILLTHVLQPWAEARAANTANGWIICTAFGMAMGEPNGKNLPPAGAADDCPQCIGASASGVAKQKMLVATDFAFPVAAFRHAIADFTGRKAPVDRLNEPPPAIRAPPQPV